MSIPKGILEWAVYCNLHDYKDTQMILLKGHLLIEEVLTSIVGNDDLSFMQKLAGSRLVQILNFLLIL
ncbi:hypothetical protein [Thiomicrorhabdus sp.]|uniref:hypothetical protein n=1 Tax=Thiomicrorhabdus sp. TaxID=2039724 RepID=UPI0029C7BBD5|nr:hypothetical protein [Thiomicrorhabdus sp.]